MEDKELRWSMVHIQWRCQRRTRNDSKERGEQQQDSNNNMVDRGRTKGKER